MRSGQEVLCIDASTPQNGSIEHFKQWIVQDKVYTIRRIENSLHGPKRILLEEIVNPPVYMPQVFGKMEPAFSANRFRVLADVPQEEFEESALFTLKGF